MIFIMQVQVEFLWENIKSIFKSELITQHSDTTAEIVALTEAMAWIKVIQTTQNVTIPKKLNLFMERKYWVKWLNSKSNGRGLLGQENQFILNVIKSFQFEEIAHLDPNTSIRSFLEK